MPPSSPPKMLALADAEAVGTVGEVVPAAPEDTVAAYKGENVTLAERVKKWLCVAAPGGALSVGPSTGVAVGLPVAPAGEMVE